MACGQGGALGLFSVSLGNLVTETDFVRRALSFIKPVAEGCMRICGHVFIHWNLVLKIWKNNRKTLVFSVHRRINQGTQEWGCAKRTLYPGVEGSHGTHAVHSE